MKRRITLVDGDGWQYHHVVSRVVDRRIIFGETEKEYFQRWMHRYSEFCGVRVLTYCLMGNHFHMLVGLSQGEAERFASEGSDAELLARVAAIYEPAIVAATARELAGYRQNGDTAAALELRASLLSRMGDLSAFVREVKLRFSRWFNGRNDRVGTLWESRFRSVLIEGRREVLETVAAYIDLNPVRAKLVRDPKEFRYSGYAEALGSGRPEARRGIASVVDLAEEAESGAKGWWEEAQRRYRLLLFGQGTRTGSVTPESLQAAIDAGGHLSKDEALRCRIRYLTEGGAIGSKAFLEDLFLKEKAAGKFGASRKTGSREMRHAEWGDIATLRNLQVAPVSAPNPTP